MNTKFFGLTTEQVEGSRKKFGINFVQKKEGKSAFFVFLINLIHH